MFIIETKDFGKELIKLPKKVKVLFRKQKAIFEENWLNPRLHTKRIKELAGVYSFRITRSYRALFYFRGNEAIFFNIGHRKDIYSK